MLRALVVGAVFGINKHIEKKDKQTMARDSMTQRQASVVEELKSIGEFFGQLHQPKNLDLVREKARQFCKQNSHLRIALVTVSIFHQTLTF